MPKNIVVCSDGTGNTAIKGRGTNVFKLFEAVDINGHHTNPHLTPQNVIYDDGVGTEDFKPLKLIGGAFGYGLTRNVKKLYRELVRIYDENDQIYLFGFSRGAFTVRTLAGMIHTCGILDASKLETNAALENAVDEAYAAYRERYRSKLETFLLGDNHDAVVRRLAEFRDAYSRKGELKIRFIGVWDTVDAVGAPLHLSDVINATIYRYKFPDQSLNDSVKHACHALSIDDARESFHPVLWNEDPRIEQVWFAGVHSNVGGGYPKQGMSLVALTWMMQKAKEHGLRILSSDFSNYSSHQNVDDKLYDSRSGLGVFYRWLPRDIARLCQKANISRTNIHLSVLERISHGTDDYAPGNLPFNSTVVYTSTGDMGKNEILQARASSVEQTLAVQSSQLSLLDAVRSTVTIGRFPYYLFLVSVLTILCALATVSSGLTWHFWLGLLKIEQLRYRPLLLTSVISGFVLSYLFSLAVRWMEREPHNQNDATPSAAVVLPLFWVKLSLRGLGVAIAAAITLYLFAIAVIRRRSRVAKGWIEKACVLTFMASALATVLLLFMPDTESAKAGWTFLKSLGGIVSELSSLNVSALAQRVIGLWNSDRILTLSASAGLLSSLLLSKAVGITMSKRFSEFAHRAQPKLREGLKRARLTRQKTI